MGWSSLPGSRKQVQCQGWWVDGAGGSLVPESHGGSTGSPPVRGWADGHRPPCSALHSSLFTETCHLRWPCVFLCLQDEAWNYLFHSKSQWSWATDQVGWASRDMLNAQCRASGGTPWGQQGPTPPPLSLALASRPAVWPRLPWGFYLKTEGRGRGQRIDDPLPSAWSWGLWPHLSVPSCNQTQVHVPMAQWGHIN